MAPRRWWSFAMAAVSVVAFLVGVVLAVAPPAPDCGEGPALYCEERAYGVLKATILTLWILASVLLATAGWLLWHLHRHPPAPPARPGRGPTFATQTRDGRRLVSARSPPEQKRP